MNNPFCLTSSASSPRGQKEWNKFLKYNNEEITFIFIYSYTSIFFEGNAGTGCQEADF
jgi:hypothetical protein